MIRSFLVNLGIELKVSLRIFPYTYIGSLDLLIFVSACGDTTTRISCQRSTDKLEDCIKKRSPSVYKISGRTILRNWSADITVMNLEDNLDCRFPLFLCIYRNLKKKEKKIWMKNWTNAVKLTKLLAKIYGVFERRQINCYFNWIFGGN